MTAVLDELSAVEHAVSIGQILKRERELKQMSLEELAQTTRIPLRMLRYLESNRFDELPGDVFARGFVRSYARAVGLDAKRLLSVYDAGRTVPAEEVAAAPITAITPPERGRRFGIAIAVVILLILFTLALSIVLRPRHRDQPVELSYVMPKLPCAHEPSSFAASTSETLIESSPS